jgi:hypothetical protein
VPTRLGATSRLPARNSSRGEGGLKAGDAGKRDRDSCTSML